MKKSRFFVIAGALCASGLVAAGGVGDARAAHPTWNQQQQFQMQQQQMMMQQPMMVQQPMMMQQPGMPMMVQPMQGQQQFLPRGAMPHVTTAANPTRITGGLPQVGSNSAVNPAGRRYFYPDTYDRLSDSGLYVGLSIAYATSTGGGMQADYAREANSWFVPGAFQQAGFKTETVLPLQLSVGAAINSDIRVDFSYMRYSGMSYPNSVQTSDGAGGYFGVQATGGAVSSTATMLNLYYNLDSYTGYLAGGAMRPYVGIGLGISTNTIADYLVLDKEFYGEVDEGLIVPPGTLTAISDIFAYHAGGTMESISYMLELGVTTEMEGGVKLDFFLRYANLGKVQSSGSIVVSQTEWLATGHGLPIGEIGSEEPAPYDSVFHYTNYFESGNISSVDIGVRLRLQF